MAQKQSQKLVLKKEIIEISLLTNLIIGAICTIIYEFFIGHIFETFKIQQQTSNTTNLYIIFKKLTSNPEKGLFGIWDGFLPWGLLMSTFKGATITGGIYFAKYFIFIKLFKNNLLITSLSSATGGFIQGIVMGPLLLLKTKVITNPKFRKIKGGIY